MDANNAKVDFLASVEAKYKAIGELKYHCHRHAGEIWSLDVTKPLKSQRSNTFDYCHNCHKGDVTYAGQYLSKESTEDKCVHFDEKTQIIDSERRLYCMRCIANDLNVTTKNDKK